MVRESLVDGGEESLLEGKWRGKREGEGEGGGRESKERGRGTSFSCCLRLLFSLLRRDALGTLGCCFTLGNVSLRRLDNPVCRAHLFRRPVVVDVWEQMFNEDRTSVVARDDEEGAQLYICRCTYECSSGVGFGMISTVAGYLTESMNFLPPHGCTCTCALSG